MNPQSERLSTSAAEVARLRAAPFVEPRDVRVYQALKHWQAERLARTHADLLESPRYAEAARFFLDDLYGAKDFSARDQALLRVVPTLVKLLPGAALETIADAVEIDLLTERYDRKMTAWLVAAGECVVIDEASYANAYRATATRDQRLRQIELIGHIGQALDRLVRHPLIGSLLKAMSRPARMAGVEAMHDFLMRGYDAFRAMRGADEFLALVEGRESVICNRLFDGAERDWVIVEPA